MILKRKPARLKAGASHQTTGSTAEAQELLAELAELDPNAESLTEEEAGELKELLKELTDQGNAALPVIQEFLEQNKDIKFGKIKGGELFGHASLRVGLFDALRQIGGEEAVALCARTLEGTKDPMEIAYLARSLEQLAPTQYRDKELALAQDTLELAAGGEADLPAASALFELMQRYGDANVVPTLEKAVPKWNYYATLALAGLPDGAGIPSLIRLAQDPAVAALGSGDYALRVLAQVSLQYPEARNALVEQARLDQVPDTAWPTVAQTIAGNYIQYGNQIFGATATSVNWSNQQLINQRVELIDQVLAVSRNPVARQTLAEARASLLERLKE